MPNTQPSFPASVRHSFIPEDSVSYEFTASTYLQLNHLASRLLKQEWRRAPLDASELVHEAWLRLANVKVNSEGHARALYLTTMQRILMDMGRRRSAFKRSGCLNQEPLDAFEARAAQVDPRAIYAVRVALIRLASKHKRYTHALVLRFVCGLAIREIAARTSVSERTIKRDLRIAQSRLRAELEPRGDSPAPACSGRFA